MDPIVHGALSFRPAARGRKAMAFTCGDHPHRGQASGRYRVAIAGHPILRTEHHASMGELHLCPPCVKRWIREWDEALAIPAEVAV